MQRYKVRRKTYKKMVIERSSDSSMEQEVR